jgi:hypothetical protein
MAEWVDPSHRHLEFTSTVSAVEGILRVGGPLPRSELVRRVTTVYPVSHWAIANALKAERFGQTHTNEWDLVERGAKRRHPQAVPKRPKTVDESLDGRYLTFPRVVDTELLRGSAIFMHRYVAWRAGVTQQGGRRSFNATDQPDLTIRRHFGSCKVSTLRHQARVLGAAIGDTLSITLDLQDGAYQIALVPADTSND